MSKDITQRLRDYARDYTTTTYNDDLIREAVTEIAELRQKLDKWVEKAKNWTASPEAGKMLDGYRAMGAKCAELEAERDQLRQQLAATEPKT